MSKIRVEPAQPKRGKKRQKQNFGRFPSLTKIVLREINSIIEKNELRVEFFLQTEPAQLDFLKFFWVEPAKL